MAIRLLNVEQQTLKHFGFFVGIVYFEFHILEFSTVDHSDSAVDSHRLVVAWYKEDQTNLRIAFDIAVAVKQFVSRDVGNEKLPVVENLHEPGRAALRRRVAIAIGVARRQHAKGRVPDKILNPWRPSEA